jgi:acyl dehydratase
VETLSHHSWEKRKGSQNPFWEKYTGNYMTNAVSLEEFRKLVGKEICVSTWKEVQQDQIYRFADCTGDHQWIHVDQEKAVHGPFGKTIAHGFLILSHIPFFNQSSVVPVGAKMTVNYGLNKVRFLNPVMVGSKIRDRIFLSKVDVQQGGRILVTTNHTIEIEGEGKPACVAECLTLIFI